MTKPRAVLTELEGAILGVLRRDPTCTAYRVRQVFRASRSAEWSGSAGAVYPAIHRLVSDGLIKESTAADARGTQTYRLTKTGEAAHDRWLCDVERAVSPGIDPFRTRMGTLSVLSAAKRRKLLTDLKAAITEARENLQSTIPTLDEDDKAGAELHLALLELRLRWLGERK